MALSPYFIEFPQEELIDYFRALADQSRAPLFLYDLPQRTRTKLEIDTVLALAEHPNIVGIKCSGEIEQTRRLLRAVEGSSFRVIVSNVSLFAALLREGIREHLDGAFSIAPHCTREIATAAARGDWAAADHAMETLSGLLSVLHTYGIFQAMTAILNTRGNLGNFAPRPMRPLTAAARQALLREPAVAAIAPTRT